MLQHILKASCNNSGATKNNHNFDLGAFVSRKTIKTFTVQDIFEEEYTKEEIQYNPKFPLYGCVLFSFLLSPYVGAILLLGGTLFLLYLSITIASLVVAILFLEAFAIQKPIMAKIGLCATGFILIFEIFLIVNTI